MGTVRRLADTGRVVDILEGFALIGIVIALGWFLARRGVLSESDQAVLARVTFTVGAPALLFLIVSRADLRIVLSAQLIPTAIGVLVAVLVYVVIARLWWRRSLAHLVVGSMAASYVNANNLGLPIAVYVLGDGTLVTSMLLLQLLLLQPVWLACLDIAQARAGGRAVRPLGLLVSPVRNPLTMAAVLGLVVNVATWRLPDVVIAPLDLVGGIAIPAMLLAFGISLHAGPRVGAAGTRAELGLISVVKLLLMPLVTWLCATFLLDLDARTVLAATVIAALPTANNVFVFAVRYRQNVALARDANALTTILALPIILLLAAVLS